MKKSSMDTGILQSLIRLKTWELEVSIVDGNRANQTLSNTEKEFKDTSDNVHNLENEIRTSYKKFDTLSLSNMQIQNQYLNLQRELLKLKEDEKHCAENVVVQIYNQIKQQKQKLQMYEKLHEKYINSIKYGELIRNMHELDELCMQGRNNNS